MSRLVATAAGVVAMPSEWSEADLLRNWYLIPARLHRIDGDRHACHINRDGAPLCGATLNEPYEATRYKCAYLLCPECEQATEAGMVQASLLEASA
jgi:hypothetical protein